MYGWPCMRLALRLLTPAAPLQLPLPCRLPRRPRRRSSVLQLHHQGRPCAVPPRCAAAACAGPCSCARQLDAAGQQLRPMHLQATLPLRLSSPCSCRLQAAAATAPEAVASTAAAARRSHSSQQQQRRLQHRADCGHHSRRGGAPRAPRQPAVCAAPPRSAAALCRRGSGREPRPQAAGASRGTLS